MEYTQETNAQGEVKTPTKPNRTPLIEDIPSSPPHSASERDQKKLLHEIRYHYFAQALKELK